jgi:ribosomal protein L11 methyltransferase
MEATYVSLTVDLPESSAELLEDLLHELGALGLEVRDLETPPMPGMRRPAPGEVIVVAYFEDQPGGRAAEAEVRERFPAARVELSRVAEKDWSNEWKALIRAVEVGRLWVGPPWLAGSAPADRIKVVVEPKMAFGTGDHPTTSLCLAAVDEYLAEHPGASVLDVGTGTGVLAIAAQKLGAGRTVGLDNDEVSVALAKETAEANGAPEVELSDKTLDQVEGRFDLVLANILANTLVELAPEIVAKVADRLVLAGVLVHQREQVESAYLAQGLVSHRITTQGEWVRIDLRRS